MRRLVHGVLVALLSAGALAGCGDDDPPEAEPSTSPTATTTSPSSSESASPTDEPSPSVEPASGRQMSYGSLTVRFPEGYDVRRIMGRIPAGSGPNGEHIAVTGVETVTQDSLDKLAKDALADIVFTSGSQRHEDVEVDGVTMYHVSGPVGAGQTRDLIGVEHGGFQMQLQFTTALPKAARQELIDSVLASITWS